MKFRPPFGPPEALPIFIPISFDRIFMNVPPEALPIFATAIKLLERRTPKEVPRATEDTRAIAGGEIVPSATELLPDGDKIDVSEKTIHTQDKEDPGIGKRCGDSEEELNLGE